MTYWSACAGCDVPDAEDLLRPASWLRPCFSHVGIPFPAPLVGTFCSSLSYLLLTSWVHSLTSQVFSLQSPQFNWPHIFHRLMKSHHLRLCIYHTIWLQNVTAKLIIRKQCVLKTWGCKQEEGSWSALLTALFFADYLCYAFLNDTAYHHSVYCMRSVSNVAYLYKHHLTLLLRLDLYQMLFFFQQPERMFVSIFIEENDF